MEACHTSPNVVLGGSGEMGFIFPQLHPGFDAMFCIAKVMEMLSLQDQMSHVMNHEDDGHPGVARQTLGQIRSELPRVCHRSLTVRCPWNVKGSLMRHLVETHSPETIELVDGVKIFSPDRESWILTLPDAGEPLVHLYADSCDRHWVDKTLREYRKFVQDFVEREMGIEEAALLPNLS
jgi:mannose-1-phosphate guanylyltransferase/phosphomannomutase